MLAGPLPPSDMEVAFGYRAPLPANNVAPTVVAFLPGWVGYAWAFPRPDHLSFGIATTQDAFKHEPLDDLLWQFMIGYYEQCEGAKVKFWQSETGTPERTRIQEHLRATAERYAARIPGLAAKTWDSRKTCGDRLGIARRRGRLRRSRDRRRYLLRVAFGGVICRKLYEWSAADLTRSVGAKISAPSCDAPRKCAAVFTATSGVRHLPNA